MTTPWNELSAEQLVEAMEGASSLAADIAELEHAHHHEHHHDEEHHCCGHHEHHHDDEHHCCGHHEHHHDEEHHCCGHHDHEHHHDEEHGCCCGHHDHDHHHHHDHHADEVFTSWGVETTHKFTKAEIQAYLLALDSGRFGMILRAKGIVAGKEGEWIHFDYVPGEINIRSGSAAVIGKICVIGAQLDQDGIARVFGV